MRRAVALAFGLWFAVASAAHAQGFADWSAVVVAGDWKGARGGPTEAFDNARRDVASALQRAGFRPEHVRQFSAQPDADRLTRPEPAEPLAVFRALGELTARAPGGCLVYLTTHGLPQGALVGERILAPNALAALLGRACGARPTVVVVSACYSGVFVGPLAAPNRMVITAARPDRTSFGCGESDRYPYFDACFLDNMAAARDFPGLAAATRVCVSDRERAEGVAPPSEPQVWVGGELRPILPLYGLQPRR